MHKDMYSLYIDRDESIELIQEKILKYITGSMRKIYNYVSRYDGVNREYRYLFTSKQQGGN